MKVSAIIGGIVGLCLSAWLLENYGVERVLELLHHAGWFGILTVAAFHLVQILFSALGWRLIAGPTVPQPSLRTYMVMRWIREGVNNLLPVGQIGGEFVVARLLQRCGMQLTRAIAGTVADLTMEMLTQILFTLLSLLLLLHSVGDAGIAGYVISGPLIAVLIAASFVGSQWLGLASGIEKGLMRLGRSFGWSATANVTGLHDALIGCYRSPGRIGGGALWQLVSWLLGGVEVCLAMHFLGHDVDFVPGLIIESLGQALKAVGFAVPGAMGVQEGRYIVICHVFGMSPEMAIALSLMKRLREVGLGVPGLLAWYRAEVRPLGAPMSSIQNALPMQEGIL